jgi:hypothetical protein
VVVASARVVAGGVAATATPTPSSPFIPAPAPRHGQMNSYLPFFASTTVIVAEAPERPPVTFPVHEFSAVL